MQHSPSSPHLRLPPLHLPSPPSPPRPQYGYDWREALVSTWGGLRGAVSLALSVALSLDEQIVDCAQHVLDAPCISGGDQACQSSRSRRGCGQETALTPQIEYATRMHGGCMQIVRSPNGECAEIARRDGTRAQH
eukprot:6214359-Pleurochrysis_carterae.AAC.6